HGERAARRARRTEADPPRAERPDDRRHPERRRPRRRARRRRPQGRLPRHRRAPRGRRDGDPRDPNRTADAMTKNGTPPRLAVQKPVRLLPAEDEARLLDRGRAADPAVERAVASVLADVRARGDDALREQTLRYDGVRLDALEVPAEAGVAALEALDPGVRAALEEAAANIAAFHRAQLPPPLEVEVRP